ncbi:sensor histidine kinase [Filimonas effusa]|nr:PAS domain-containing sensor histidine kinase [Filimonas effusa]
MPTALPFIENNMEHFTLEEIDVHDNEAYLQFGTWSYTIGKPVITWSDGMYLLFGYDPVQDKPALLVNHDLYYSHMFPEDIERAKKINASFNEYPGRYGWEFRIRDRQGRIKTLETNARIIRDNKGALLRVVGTTRDITDLRSYQEGLEGKIMELNRSNKELEEFAYIASHDLQEPLRKFNTFGERLHMKYADVLGDDGNFYLSRMMAAAGVMRALIENLLEYSRVTGSNHEFLKVSLDDIVKQVVSNQDLRIEEAGAAVVIENELPEIEAIASQMHQLFNNLLSNAIKFRRKDVKSQITISARKMQPGELSRWPLLQKKQVLRIEVKDNGIGFDQSDAQRIFQIFQRLHGKAEYEGTGIGLSICKRIVEMHNGIIYAEGRPDEGASFIILLPETR